MTKTEAQPITLPRSVPGHWDSKDGQDIAQRYASLARADLLKGDVSDLALANFMYMAGRADLDLSMWQTAAKDRIRWLSAQLAIAQGVGGATCKESLQVRLLQQVLEAIDTGRSEPLFVMRDVIRNHLADAEAAAISNMGNWGWK